MREAHTNPIKKRRRRHHIAHGRIGLENFYGFDNGIGINRAREIDERIGYKIRDARVAPVQRDAPCHLGVEEFLSDVACRLGVLETECETVLLETMVFGDIAAPATRIFQV